jgi:hypothetical protein
VTRVPFAGPDKKLKLSLNYPASVGRNMDEIVRVTDALMLSAKHSIVSVSASSMYEPLPRPSYMPLLVASTSGVTNGLL